jgi:feruloyl-CoA synthase
MRAPNELFAKPAVETIRRADGTLILRSLSDLGAYPASMGTYLEHWAMTAPDRAFLVERDQHGIWQVLTYGQVRQRVRRVATALLKRGLTASRPVMVLSDNSIEHAIIMLAAMHSGVPSVSVSPAYSLMSADFAKLRRIVSLVEPGVIYADSTRRYGPAFEAVRELHAATLVCGQNQSGRGTIGFEELEAEEDAPAVDDAFARVGPDTIAKLLFTSGSTGEPKGVINTQRMLVSNQQARAQCWPFLEREAPILVDWLPWSHTFGGNHNFNLVLRFGGTMYIDTGRPTPGRFSTSLTNLSEIAPTIYFNVPRGYEMLAPALKAQAELRSTFFSRLRVIFYAAAALPQHVWQALMELTVRPSGERVQLVSAWGATETAPLVTDCHFQAARSGCIGVPVPGATLKLLPSGEKLEVRVRGPNVTPGYFKRPNLTAQSFDEEGFYRIGDAVRFVDEEHPDRGLAFDGRVSEDFKLDSGTWVNVTALRLRAIGALTPVAQDVVITGHDCRSVGILIFPDIPACAALCAGLPADPATDLILSHPNVRAHVASALEKLRAEGAGSSMHPIAALLMSEPPSIDAGEITDKGYINQSAVLRRRRHLVDRLHAADSPDVIGLSQNRDSSDAPYI